MITEPPQTTLPRRTILLNASSLKVSNCQRRYNNVVVQGLRTTNEHEALNFGKAVHRFAESILTGSEITVALGHAQTEYRGQDLAKLIQACMAMPAGIATPYKDYVEHKFHVYWRNVVYNDVQYDIYVCGTMDVVTMFSDGAIQIVDWKTTRRWKQSEVFATYRVSVQMKFYLWAAIKFGPAIFDMSVANETRRGNVFLRIGAVMLSAKPPTWVMSPPIQFTLDELDEFEARLSEHLAQVILPAWDNPQPTGMLNETCDGCDFIPLCFAPNELSREQARAGYKVVPYDPANF